MGKKTFLTGFATLIGVTLICGVGFAKTMSVNVYETAKLANGPVLKAGDYKLEVVQNSSQPEAVFYQGKEVVAKVPVKLVPEPSKAPYTEVSYANDSNDSTRTITDIWPDGWNQMLVFGKTSQISKATK